MEWPRESYECVDVIRKSSARRFLMGKLVGLVLVRWKYRVSLVAMSDSFQNISFRFVCQAVHH
jgi:hypothetical protein